MDEALRVGVVGAGPWAHRVHGPGLSAHPGTRLAAVWARRPDAAKTFAESYDAAVVDGFDELLESVDAVAFAVPPAVQAELAPRAARAGKHLVLEKPLAADPAGAREIVEAVDEAGVAALLMLTRRYAPEVQEWLAGVRGLDGVQGGTGRWLAGGLLAGDYAASEWRQQQDGALIDAGPHAIDLLDAALGEIEQVHFAHRSSDGLWQLVFGHDGDLTSTLTLSLRMPVQPAMVDFAVYGEHGQAPLLGRRTAARECYARMLDDLLAMIREERTEHPCDVRRGLHLQQIIADVLAAV
ncbi:Gfo/Idh/MocA family protein [Saccharopolyspora elongata]|uniref:Gfo/Idh/MocA family oxidoreductase n=1 Tax=Saccharopolyspora elongata TaxID=2530387 RepID=A0A4R4YAX9_9PSEU|nr:Gfo/Idh/MocA family oxidoreductase [Saccharopolyspora elongata]TDD41721.1 Gfo/Idh/MocA family oxidoreductase [Saccharopolyspora elongata]